MRMATIVRVFELVAILETDVGLFLAALEVGAARSLLTGKRTPANPDGLTVFKRLVSLNIWKAAFFILLAHFNDRIACFIKVQVYLNRLHLGSFTRSTTEEVSCHVK